MGEERNFEFFIGDCQLSCCCFARVNNMAATCGLQRRGGIWLY